MSTTLAIAYIEKAFEEYKKAHADSLDEDVVELADVMIDTLNDAFETGACDDDELDADDGFDDQPELQF